MTRRARTLVIGVAALFLATMPASAVAGGPSLAVFPVSGPPGTGVSLVGGGYEAGSTYGLCILPADQFQCGYVGVELGSFTAESDGGMPMGTSVVIPNEVAGSYIIAALAPGGTAAIVASGAFTVTATSLAVNPASGAAGTRLELSGSGYAPGATYQFCFAAGDAANCGAAVPLGTFVATDSGAVPAGTLGTAPGNVAGSYRVGAYLDGPLNTIIAAAGFTMTAPVIGLEPATAGPGASVAVSGSGFAAGATYIVCLVPAGTTSCGYAGVYVGSFVADANGSVPAGTAVVVPDPTAPGDYELGALLVDNPILLASGPLLISASATSAPSVPAPPTGAAPSGSTPPVITPPPASSGDGGSLLIVVIVLLVAGGLVAYLILARRKKDEPTAPQL